MTERAMTERNAVEFDNVNIVFGDRPEAALPLMDQGLERGPIKTETGQVLGVHNCSLTVKEGEILVLMGLSGSGKSTLLRAVNGLNSVCRGDVRVWDGDRMASVSNAGGAELRRLRRERVAMVFQQFGLLPWRTVRENVGLGLELAGMPAAERARRVDAQLATVNLTEWADRKVGDLSGGMQQRVGLARAFATEAPILLMDEPFSALDVLTAETLRTDLLDLWSEGRMPIKSILLVTHNIEEAVLMCDRIVLFSSNPGRVAGEIKVDLPQPRSRQDPAFRALVEDVYVRMTQRPQPGEPRQGLFPGTGLGMVLPRVSTNALAGLTEAIVAAPHDGKADLPELASALNYEADDLFPIAEVLQLLRFAEIEGGDIKLLTAGRRYATADVDERKRLFAQHLLAYVPIVAHIRRVLDERPTHQAPGRRFRDELEDFMSEELADQTLRTVTQWGRYGELYAYDEVADLFSLDNPA